MSRSFIVGALVFAAVGSACFVACSGAGNDDVAIPLENSDGDGGVFVVGPDGTMVSSPTVPDLGKECVDAAGCLSNICLDNRCQQPTSTDGVKNQDETDIDCGGTYSPKCEPTKNCATAADCTSSVCNGTCRAPSFNDGVKNGLESDLDCGGIGAPDANKCDTGKACVQHDDCKSDGCGDDGKCSEGRSCTQLHGGRTCGRGEFGEGDAQHENCCKELAVPTRGSYVDKYLVTAGRMRAFIERVNGNVRGAVSSNPKWVGAWTQYLPTSIAEVNEQLGPIAQDWEWPPNGLNGYPRGTWAARGCQINGGGSRTYYQARTDDEQKYPKDVLDEKALNCVTIPMLLAFCLWDGKDLADPDDLHAAWVGNDNRDYPWGNNPQPSTNDYANFNQAVVRFSYQYPAYIGPDASVHISAPGRKYMGNGPFGHADLAGNVIELSHRANSSTVFWLSSGSWERHTVVKRGNVYSDAATAFNRRYYAIGGRCGHR